ncbi:MAG: glutamate-5-semialdehyde dehydrogenase [Clostridia bacterium]|nr:glutamate-5-semialdehyde dehydrogenase [Clostridia bacterium]
MTTLDILKKAKAAEKEMLRLTTEDKNRALSSMAQALESEAEAILEANTGDVEAARGHISDVMIDRLSLDKGRIVDMADGLRALIDLPDPVGKVLERNVLPNGLIVEKTSVAMGVVAIIYESRPNVTSDAAGLALKSGNVCVLRSGKEAYLSAAAIVDAMRKGLSDAGVSPYVINLVNDTSRQSANELMTADGYIDLLIPRGGPGLINACVRNATVPCIQTGTGICHIYVDKYADLDMALNIIENAKTSRPSVCNAEEVCLVNADIASEFLPMLKDRLTAGAKHPVELRLDERAAEVIEGTPAGENDFDTEFLDYVLAVGVVDDVDEAIRHIAEHSTHHSDAIITGNSDNADKFCRETDSAAVYVNASTRFTDGGQFGLGCEMGISTQKLHARGPMGLRELTTYKYIVKGNGQIR